jgi:hypothetical protein
MSSPHTLCADNFLDDVVRQLLGLLSLGYQSAYGAVALPAVACLSLLSSNVSTFYNETTKSMSYSARRFL